jgi:hypothetical protein
MIASARRALNRSWLAVGLVLTLGLLLLLAFAVGEARASSVMPDCDGMTGKACLAAVTASGWSGEVRVSAGPTQGYAFGAPKPPPGTLDNGADGCGNQWPCPGLSIESAGYAEFDLYDPSTSSSFTRVDGTWSPSDPATSFALWDGASVTAALNTAPDASAFTAGLELGITVGVAAIVALVGISIVRKLLGL